MNNVKWEEVAHHYIGCEVRLKGAEDSYKRILSSVGSFLEASIYNEVGFCEDLEQQGDIEDYIPVLRDIDDIANEDLLALFRMCYTDVFDHEPEGFEPYILTDGNQKGLKADEVVEVNGEVKRWSYGLTVNRKEVWFTSQGDTLNINQWAVAFYLVGRGYDMFGLIESGQAEAKTGK